MRFFGSAYPLFVCVYENFFQFFTSEGDGFHAINSFLLFDGFAWLCALMCVCMCGAHCKTMGAIIFPFNWIRTAKMIQMPNRKKNLQINNKMISIVWTHRTREREMLQAFDERTRKKSSHFFRAASGKWEQINVDDCVSCGNWWLVPTALNRHCSTCDLYRLAAPNAHNQQTTPKMKDDC